MEGQITIQEWQQWKEDIRKKLQEAAGNFVYIGYRLKQIKDSKAYQQEGYEDIYSFAEREYGLTKAVTSRFMAISVRFGDGIELKEEYKNFGSSKLAEMLTLSDTDICLITEQTTVKDIRELKKFNKQEIEDGKIEEAVYTPVQKCIIDFFKDKRKELDSIIRMMIEEVVSEARERAICEEMNPTGCANHKKGIVFLLFYPYEQGVKIKKFGQEEAENITWQELSQEILKIYEPFIGEDLTVYENFYGPIKEEIKEKQKDEKSKETTEVATSQQTMKKEEKNEEKKHKEEKIKDVIEKKEELEKEELAEEEKQSKTQEENNVGDKETEYEHPVQASIGDETTVAAVVDGDSKIAVIREAEKLAEKVKIFGWNDEEKPVTREEIKEMKENAEKLVELLEKLLDMEEDIE